VIYLKDRSITWSPLNVPEKRVPGHVVQDQRTAESPVYIRLDGNGQLLVVAPERVCPRGRWDGHEWDPAGKLGAVPVPPGPLVEMPLPDRLVYAAEQAIDEARVCGVTDGNQPVYVEGYLADFARAATAVVVEGLAAVLEGELCCGREPDPQCGKCGRLYGEIAELRYLAERVRNVKAVA
jgi:hypothetical protein